MKDVVKLVLSLTLICVISSAILAAVYQVTKSPIARAQEERTLRAAAQVMPAGVAAPTRRTAGEGFEYFVSERDGQPAAWAVVGVSEHGYGGVVKLMVGLDAEGKFVDFAVVEASETPGLGSKMVEPEFREPLKALSAPGEWKVKKDGGEVEAITAATISSRAVTEAINDAAQKVAKLRAAR